MAFPCPNKAAFAAVVDVFQNLNFVRRATLAREYGLARFCPGGFYLAILWKIRTSEFGENRWSSKNFVGGFPGQDCLYRVYAGL
jgi:hypothetical protein